MQLLSRTILQEECWPQEKVGGQGKSGYQGGVKKMEGREGREQISVLIEKMVERAGYHKARVSVYLLVSSIEVFRGLSVSVSVSVCISVCLCLCLCPLPLASASLPPSPFPFASLVSQGYTKTISPPPCPAPHRRQVPSHSPRRRHGN